MFDKFFPKKSEEKIDNDDLYSERFNYIIRRIDRLVYLHSNKNIIISYYIRVIVESLNYHEARLALESDSDNSQVNHDNSIILDIYKSLERDLFPEKNVKSESVCREISINNIPILLNPWNGDRILDNLYAINTTDNVFNGEKFKWNIDNTFITPLNIVICKGASCIV